MAELLEIVQKACLPAIWSQGVKLVRESAVLAEAAAGTEEHYRVRAAGFAVPVSVTLYPQDGEWSCDCGGRADPCAHVAAAAIFASRGEPPGTFVLPARSEPEEVVAPTPPVAPARSNGPSVPTPERPAAPKPVVTRGDPPRLIYRLAVRERVLTFSRFLAVNGKEDRVQNLASELARGRLPRSLAPTHDDLTLDRLLQAHRRDSVPLDRTRQALAALSSSQNVWFAGKSVKTSGEVVLPRAVLEDGKDGGFRLRLEKDPAVDEVIAMGVVRCGDTLRALAETSSTGYFLERLPLLREFPREQQGELVGRVLPELENRLSVEIATKRLSRADRNIRPRIFLDLSHHGHTLSVLPMLVYGDPPVLRIDGDRATLLGEVAPMRHRDQERALLLKLRDVLNLVPGRRVDLDGAEAIRFAAKLRDFQRSTGDESHARVFGGAPLTPKLLTDGDQFDLSFEVAGEGAQGEPRRASALSVLRAYQDGLDLVPLEGGGWAPLPTGWLSQHGHRLADLMAARKADKTLPTASLPDLGALCDALEAPPPPALERLRPLFSGFQGIPAAALPKDLQAELRHYQQLGVDWLSFLRSAGLGAVLADDMGLGKTLQTICVLSGRVLVVCPKSVVYNWAEEIKRFRPGLVTATYHGARRELDQRAHVTLTTYAVLRLDHEHLAAQNWDIIVLDEAQAIKNADSQTARAAFKLKGDFRVALSGTPVENRLEELWSILHFCNPGFLGGRSDFDERYAAPIASGSEEAGRRLRAKVQPFIMRRLKREVLPELPPRSDAVLHVELDDTERAVYDTVRAATQKELMERLSHGEGVLAVLEALLRLRQAACHSGLVPGQVAERSSKIDRLLEALEEAAEDGHKALVFSQWTGLLDRVEPHLRAANIPFLRLDGSTRDRGAVVNAFQSEQGPPVMLVSLKAGGTGLNLTAADHVFLLDPWWNPAVEDQAADRAHRIGQDKPVMVYRMVAKDTVEERILSLQTRKRQLAEVALGQGSRGEAITREELLALLD